MNNEKIICPCVSDIQVSSSSEVCDAKPLQSTVSESSVELAEIESAIVESIVAESETEPVIESVVVEPVVESVVIPISEQVVNPVVESVHPVNEPVTDPKSYRPLKPEEQNKSAEENTEKPSLSELVSVVSRHPQYKDTQLGNRVGQVPLVQLKTLPVFSVLDQTNMHQFSIRVAKEKIHRQCLICNKQFSSLYMLNKHTALCRKLDKRKKDQDNKKSVKEPYKCYTCNKAFVSAIGLIQHNANIHGHKTTINTQPDDKEEITEKSKFCCNVCNLSHFSTYFSLKKHIQSAHPKIHVDFTSLRQQTKDKISQLSHLQSHKTPMKSKKIKYLNKKPLNQEVSSTGVDSELVCDICSKCFTADKALQFHRLRSHNLKHKESPKYLSISNIATQGNVTSSYAVNPKKRKLEKEFKHEETLTPNNQSFHQHSTRHSSTRPTRGSRGDNECPYCKLVCRYSWTLQRHVKECSVRLEHGSFASPKRPSARPRGRPRGSTDRVGRYGDKIFNYSPTVILTRDNLYSPEKEEEEKEMRREEEERKEQKRKEEERREDEERKERERKEKEKQERERKEHKLIEMDNSGEDRMEESMVETIKERMEEPIEEKMEEIIGERMEETIEEKMEEIIGERMEDTIKEKMEETIGERMEGTIEERMEGTIEQRMEEDPGKENQYHTELPDEGSDSDYKEDAIEEASLSADDSSDSDFDVMKMKKKMELKAKKTPEKAVVAPAPPPLAPIYKCQECRLTFSNEDRYNSHTRTAHISSTVKPSGLMCTVCKRKCLNRSVLKQHMLLIHNQKMKMVPKSKKTSKKL